MTIKAISPIDGRYKNLASEFEDIFSEYGLIKKRIFVEISWFLFLANETKLFKIKKTDIKKIESIYKNFDEKDALEVKKIEKITNHDVKSVEYYIKEKLDSYNLSDLKEWVHFAATSDDINNCSYALMVKDGKEIILKNSETLLKKIEDLALKYKKTPMMSRTHGQPASPTTVGKEFVNFAWKINIEIQNIKDAQIAAKMNGATGNFNAHHVAYPKINWIKQSKNFIENYLSIEPILFSTQINPCSYLANLLHAMVRLSALVIDLNRDMWSYISINYFFQKTKKNEVGSSTMPHKVNPIDFENSEGNMEICGCLFEHLACKLLKSRMQRDLTDSTALRNLGYGFSLFLIAIKNTLKGLNKIEANPKVMEDDLNKNIELLAEAAQTVMRVYKISSPYEKLKELTRGKKINQKDWENFIENLELPTQKKQSLKKLKSSTYTGLATKLVDEYFKNKKENLKK